MPCVLAVLLQEQNVLISLYGFMAHWWFVGEIRLQQDCMHPKKRVKATF